MLEMYDGTNAHAVLAHMRSKGLFITAIPGAEAWSLPLRGTSGQDQLPEAGRAEDLGPRGLP